MKVNPDKFQAIAIGKNTQSKNIFFNLNGNIIKTEDEVKLLLVTIDYELKFNSHITNICRTYLLTLPLFAGVSRIRALSPAWTGSHAWETLIYHTHFFLPHDLPPTKESSTIKS